MLDDKARTPQAVMEIICEQAADQINVHANWSGGFAPGLRKARLAALGGMPTMIGSTYYLGPAAAAYQIMSSVLPLEAPCEQQFNGLHDECTSIIHDPFPLADGAYTIPDRPGLGVDVDEARLDEITEQQVTLG